MRNSLFSMYLMCGYWLGVVLKTVVVNAAMRLGATWGSLMRRYKSL